MRRQTLIGLALALVTLLGGCYGEQSEDTASPGEAPREELPTVEVSAEGNEFDPPVQVAQLPSDVWYCDMGTVHYARAEEGDGVCPLCEMKLVHNVREDFEEDLDAED